MSAGLLPDCVAEANRLTGAGILFIAVTSEVDGEVIDVSQRALCVAVLSKSGTAWSVKAGKHGCEDRLGISSQEAVDMACKRVGFSAQHAIVITCACSALSGVHCGLILSHEAAEASAMYASCFHAWVLSSLAVIEHVQGEKMPPSCSINHQSVMDKTWHMKVALARASALEVGSGHHRACPEPCSDSASPSTKSVMQRLASLKQQRESLQAAVEQKFSDSTPDR